MNTFDREYHENIFEDEVVDYANVNNNRETISYDLAGNIKVNNLLKK